MSHAQLCHAYPSHFVDYFCLIYLTQQCSICAKNTAATCVNLIKSLHYIHTTLCDIATLTLLYSYAVDYMHMLTYVLLNVHIILTDYLYPSLYTEIISLN